MKKKESIKIISAHCIVWAVFIAYEISYIYMSGIPLNKIGDYGLHYLVNIFLFYFNAASFSFIFRKKINKFAGIAALIVFEIGVYLIVQHAAFNLLSLLYSYQKPTTVHLKLFYVREIYRAIYFIGFSIAYWFAIRIDQQKKVILQLENNKLRQENQSVELKNSLMQARNAYLQSQLNPHLLFNTLSFIYTSVRKLSGKASEAILLLSDMMRYSLSETGTAGKVSLQNEIDYIKNLVKLNQLRFNKRLYLKLQIDCISPNEMIIPLLLLSFIENVYKHGDLTEEAFPARITISCKDNILNMTCSNKKAKSKSADGWGIGLENAKARLDTYYPEKFALKILDADFQYSLSLILHL